MTRLVPQGVASLVPGGGHAVHLAQPEQTSRIVRHWLDAVEAGLT
jgi:pimeloyl-ACP methyl ester carboxylesterase